jgi:hypothetical protein
MTLFEYAIVYHPRRVKDAAGNEVETADELLVKPTYILAKSDKEVAMRAAREIPSEHLDHLDRIEVCVRPF